MAEETAESSRIANGEEGGLEASTPTQEPVVTFKRRRAVRVSRKSRLQPRNLLQNRGVQDFR